MSMISEQVSKLREVVENFHEWEYNRFYDVISEAADTIETLSAKLQAVNMENGSGWIKCDDRLPDKTGTYLTTSRIYFVPDHVDEPDNYIGVEMTRFSEKFGWSGEEVFSWQPLPEPYRP